MGVAKKLSATPLSQQSALRLMLTRTPMCHSSGDVIGGSSAEVIVAQLA